MPQAPFLHADGRIWTAGALGERIDACVRALLRSNVSRGDAVALMLGNSADFVACFFAIARVGAIAVTVNTAMRGEALAYILDHCDARMLVVETELAEEAHRAATTSSRLETILVRGGSRATSLEAHLESGPPALPEAARRDPGDVAAILYTSGTTGRPKGVMCTDHGYVRASSRFADALRLDGGDVLQTCLPLFHINAQQLSLCGALVAGAQLAVEPRFSASGFWDSVSRHEVTSFNLIGAMLGILAGQAPRPEERSHHVRVACVAPVPAELHQPCEERFGIRLLDGYGLTETTPGITINPYATPRAGSCGTAAPYVELRIADETGSPRPPGEYGEIQARALEPYVFMSGYYKDPDATAEAFRDGWFRTGDRGWLDDDGYVFFVDRLKDVIRRRGENISAVEIERTVLEHVGVREAAAVGVPSDIPGGEEDVALYVIPAAAPWPDPAELIRHCADRLPTFMVPRYVCVREELPRTETQRVRKAALRDERLAGCFDALGQSR